MAAIESTGTGSEIKEQYEKDEKFVGRGFLLFPPFSNMKKGMKTEEMWKKEKRSGNSRKRKRE